MGNWALRIPVWFISLSAIIGNLLVVVVIITSHFRLTVSKFLMVNLAIADLCIGIHLFLIAIVDACSIGFYFNYAIYWQRGECTSCIFYYLIFLSVIRMTELGALYCFACWRVICFASNICIHDKTLFSDYIHTYNIILMSYVKLVYIVHCKVTCYNSGTMHMSVQFMLYII